MSTVFLFSGQGSQHFDMGRSLYDGNETFRRSMARLDALVRQELGESVIETLYSSARTKSEPFDRIVLSHPAIFMVEYSLAQTLIDAGVVPDIVLGVSLGSFAASAVAGFIDVEDALKAVIEQALAFEKHCGPGGMTAVLSDPTLFDEEFLASRSELAAVNFASHFVVSAGQAELAEIEAELRRRNVAFQRLPVLYAFHSRSIDRAEAPFASFMQSIQYGEGRLRLLSGDRATFVSHLPDHYFWDAVRRPIRFREATAQLEQQGSHRYVDVGPSSTLATFLRYGLPRTTQSTVHAILTPFGTDQKNLAALLAAATN